MPFTANEIEAIKGRFSSGCLFFEGGVVFITSIIIINKLAHLKVGRLSSCGLLFKSI